jgi:cytochrome c peroxidase
MLVGKGRSFVALVFLLGSAGCDDEEPFPSDDELSQIIGLHNVHTPPRAQTNKYADSPQAAALGAKLFADPTFSSCGLIACVSCHPPPNYTVKLAFPPGCNGAVTRSVPTLLNTAFNDWFYWDGRKDALWSHPIFPLLNHTELDADPNAVKQRMQDIYAADYQAAFGLYPSGEPDVNRVIANFGKSVDAFLRTKIKVDAPFDSDLDRFVAAANSGKASSDPLYLGLKVFIRKGHCIICHKGPMLSDGSFHNLGLMQDPPDHGHLGGIVILQQDTWNGASVYSDDPIFGRAKLDTLNNLTVADLDGAFKTPTLRNIALTAPYMHTGQDVTLEEVIDFYDRGGDPVGTFAGTRAETIVKLGLNSDEKTALLNLLTSLTGSETP